MVIAFPLKSLQPFFYYYLC